AVGGRLYRLAHLLLEFRRVELRVRLRERLVDRIAQRFGVDLADFGLRLCHRLLNLLLDLLPLDAVQRPVLVGRASIGLRARLWPAVREVPEAPAVRVALLARWQTE